MTIFRDWTFTWWQVGMLKITVLFVGIAIGAEWPGFFQQNLPLLLGVAVVLAVYLTFLLFKKS